MRRLAWAILLSLLAVPDLPIRAEDDIDPEVGRLLGVVRRGEDDGAWTSAVKDLRQRGGDAAEQLGRALATLAGKRRQALVAEVRRLRALVGKIPTGRKVPTRKLESWDEARSHAHDWIFSRDSFPDIDGAIFGPKEGYDVAIQRAKLAMSRYGGISRLLRRAVAPALRLDVKDATGLRAAHAAARKAYLRVTSAMPGTKTEEDEELTVPALAWMFLEIREENFRAAAPRIRGLPRDWIRLCAFEAYGRTILERNARRTFGQSKAAQRAIINLNGYRMALGISPLSHNERLVKMATQHSTEMGRLGYLGHESPVMENYSMRDRAKKVGYKSLVEECVSGRSSATSAVETWKWDGGHHRIMVSGAHTEVGIGDKGPCTLNVGAGEKGAPPVVRY